MKATEQYFPVELLIMLHTAHGGSTFETVPETLKSWSFKWKLYLAVVLFILLSDFLVFLWFLSLWMKALLGCGAVYFAVRLFSISMIFESVNELSHR